VTTQTHFIPSLNQIAFSVVDLRLTERWFRECFGLLPAGGSRIMMRGLLPSMVQGLPKAASTCWWLVGRNPWFQLELFQFENPLAKPIPADFRPCDIGYTRIGLWVADFDQTLLNLAGLGTQTLSPPLGTPGTRRVCVRSPDGVYVEIMEDDPLPAKTESERRDCAAAIRSVTMSTPNLADSVAFMSKGIGLGESRLVLHDPEHEALWGMAGATTKSKVFEAGDVLVEVVQYLDPAGKPWPPGYRICDQGILNIAFGARSKRDHVAVYRRAVDFGARPNCRPLHVPGSGVVYVNDPQGFSVELLWMKPGKADRQWGFTPLPIGQRPDPDTRTIVGSVHINSAPTHVWNVITDHEGMARWSGFSPVRVIRQGDLERNGYGSERRMQGPPGIGTVVEQVVASQAPNRLRYRVTQGSPFVCHQGEISLVKKEQGTELNWTIRFRPRIPGTGWLLQRVLSSKLNHMLERHLKPHVEGRPSP
jgi:catechol 2,3-dioxygenase-like lactoylglutathione lyase family enzyme/uncharacterized protein YndB with AHSA1/START domain